MTSLSAKVLAEVAAMKNAAAIWGSGGFESFTYDRPADERDAVMLGQLAMTLLDEPHLSSCSLLWVSEDMVDVLVHAARSLPNFPFDHSLLPWPRAVAFTAKPLFTVDSPTNGEPEPVSALQWSDLYRDAKNLCVVSSLTHTHGADVLAPLAVMTLTPGVMWDQLTDLEQDRISNDAVTASSEQTQGIGRLCSALWLLVQQKIAVRRAWAPDRASRRRWERETDQPVPEITVVELRRPINVTPSEKGTDPVDWSHRWIVDGHWRNQYHPSTDTHVPTWIAPHVKGPDDKPLVVKRKINAWVR